MARLKACYMSLSVGTCNGSTGNSEQAASDVSSESAMTGARNTCKVYPREKNQVCGRTIGGISSNRNARLARMFSCGVCICV